MRLVLFDIDGTLVPGASSEARFARYLWDEGALGVRQLLAFAWFCLRYFPRYGRHVMQKNKAYLSGHTKAEIAALARDFVATRLSPALYPPALERLRAHQAAGDRIALLSGTPQFIADALAESLGVGHSHAALCATDGRHYTAAPPVRHPYGPTKIDAAEALARETGLSLETAVAFGDSITDAHLFRVVEEAVAVQPDKHLSEVADGAGWEVLLDRMTAPAKHDQQDLRR
ncbi:haloacid dehalogenase [Salinisphaera dokdonensis CL-ES53]|uniref:Haloacid dehalogenase n=1 Tax=Salinisphaera dokdonensis CL-ES53 TaxID=1304272 RepID=A0ABV2B087_9GAMM